MPATAPNTNQNQKMTCIFFLPDHSAESYRITIRFYEYRRAERCVDRERQDRAVSPTRSEWGCGSLRSLPLAANRRYS